MSKLYVLMLETDDDDDDYNDRFAGNQKKEAILEIDFLIYYWMLHQHIHILQVMTIRMTSR